MKKWLKNKWYTLFIWNKSYLSTNIDLRYKFWFFTIIEFSIRPCRDPTSDPHNPDLGLNLSLGTTVINEGGNDGRETSSTTWLSGFSSVKEQKSVHIINVLIV